MAAAGCLHLIPLFIFKHSCNACAWSQVLASCLCVGRNSLKYVVVHVAHMLIFPCIRVNLGTNSQETPLQ